MKYPILASLAIVCLSACAGTDSITPAQISAAEAAATPVVNALAAKYPQDTAAIDAGWAIVQALSAGTTTPDTALVTAVLPPSTTTGTAIAATNTAIAILGTPGATKAASNGTINEFVRNHPPKHVNVSRLTLYGANGETIESSAK